MLKPIDVTNLSITWKIFSTPYILFTSLTGGVWAFSAKNLTEASSLKIRIYFIKLAKIAFIFSLPFAIFFLIFGASILRFVVPSLDPPTRGMLITCSVLLPIMCVCQPFAMILNGLHRERFLVITATSGVILNFFFSVFFIRISGQPYGALLGSISAQVIGFLVPVFIHIRRREISFSPEVLSHL
jgi:Na+-driven multidrug efflux pump